VAGLFFWPAIPIIARALRELRGAPALVDNDVQVNLV